jgi:hypothetical protein
MEYERGEFQMAGIIATAQIESKPARALRRALWWLRQLSGDAAYDNYLRWIGQSTPRAPEASHSREHAASPKPLSRKDFYLDSVRRRFSTPSRCC